MTLRRRLQKLERTMPGPDPLADDPEHELWRLFYEIALEVLEPFPEARKKVQHAMGIQEPCIFRPDWEPTASGADLRFYFCKESLWAALQHFPDARLALEEFINHAEEEIGGAPRRAAGECQMEQRLTAPEDADLARQQGGGHENRGAG